MRNKKKGKLAVGPLKSPDGHVLSKYTDMANSFLEAFASSIVEGYPLRSVLAPVVDSQMREVTLTLDTVKNLPLKLDVTSTMGHYVLKPCE